MTRPYDHDLPVFIAPTPIEQDQEGIMTDA